MAENIKVLVPEAEVAKRIEELGRQISEDYAGKHVHMICVLKGGVFFMCELAKRITVPVSLDFMSVSSYGDGTSSSGVVTVAPALTQTSRMAAPIPRLAPVTNTISPASASAVKTD